jgi:hypothetical protein
MLPSQTQTPPATIRSFLMLACLMICCGATANVVYGQAIFPGTPDWESSDDPRSTGAALVDLDRDGYLDLVVANGNDITRETVAVYYNNQDGTLPSVPDWQSSDHEYNGHLSIADVNGDGWLDVAVALTLNGSGAPTARVYMNTLGTLSSLPSWESDATVAGFHVAFGDVNGDGRPDLAVGTGFPYEGVRRWRNYVYMNVNGVLETSPSWISNDSLDYMDIFFCDVDADGWQDLVGVGTAAATWIYDNNAGVLDQDANWHTIDNDQQFSVMGTYGDIDEDGWLELFITDNIQLFGGDGYFRQYDGLDGGYFTTTPTWSYYDGYGSAVALADIDFDGDLDLATGGWWDRTRYFLNSNGGYAATPTWSSSGTSVVEAIVFGDMDNDALRYVRTHIDIPEPDAVPLGHHIQLDHQPLQWIDSVSVNGVRLSPSEYTYDLVHGWVSIGPIAPGAVSIRYAHTGRPDMAITNWDGSIGNYLYYNRSDVLRFGDYDDSGAADLEDLPAFSECLAGPDVAPSAPDMQTCLEAFDTEGDGDVDLVDWSELEIVLTN